MQENARQYMTRQDNKDKTRQDLKRNPTKQ